MRLREIVRWTLSRWLAVGAGVVIAALVVGFAFGIFDSGGALAPAPTPTPTVPPFSTPTSAEINAMLAANPNLPTVPIVVIDPKTGLPAEDPPRTARQRAAPTAAEAEYLASDPERAIYLEGIDRVIHLPDGVVIWLVLDENIINWSCHPGEYAPRCPTLPAYSLKLLATGRSVTVDSDGYAFVSDSDTLPSGFDFLSGFKVVHVDVDADK